MLDNYDIPRGIPYIWTTICIAVDLVATFGLIFWDQFDNNRRAEARRLHYLAMQDEIGDSRHIPPHMD